MAHHLQVVAPVNTVHPALHRIAILFLKLCWEIVSGGKGPLACPAQFRKSLDRFRLRERKGHIFYIFLWKGSRNVKLRHKSVLIFSSLFSNCQRQKSLSCFSLFILRSSCKYVYTRNPLPSSFSIMEDRKTLSFLIFCDIFRRSLFKQDHFQLRHSYNNPISYFIFIRHISKSYAKLKTFFIYSTIQSNIKRLV